MYIYLHTHSIVIWLNVVVQCCGSVTFWYGSGSVHFYFGPDPEAFELLNGFESVKVTISGPDPIPLSVLEVAIINAFLMTKKIEISRIW